MLNNVYFKGLAGVALCAASFLFGAADGLIMALLAITAIDFATGIAKAISQKGLSSRKMFAGGALKIGLFLVVAVANIIDVALHLGGVLRAATISYFIANEAISILENWGALGLPIPQKLRDVLSQLKNDYN